MSKNLVVLAGVLFFLCLAVGVLVFKSKPIAPSNIKPALPSMIVSPMVSVAPTQNYTLWKTEVICTPVENGDTGFAPIIDLKDGTWIYKRADGTLFRGTENRCVCLSSTTMITTETGQVNVKDLKVGMLVWTENSMGKKELKPILKLSSVHVGNKHKISHIILSDGRTLEVSPSHPTADGQTAGQLKAGDIYDNSIVRSNELISYDDIKTYDLLPAGDTGYYFANGILMGSTLK